ncbi:MAG: carboxypeptidase regulatory-like domain-containing protein [Acidobacteriota bacterium]|jgi:hypothetical protein
MLETSHRPARPHSGSNGPPPITLLFLLLGLVLGLWAVLWAGTPPAAARGGPPERPEAGNASERALARQLARLDDRLHLDSFPDGSGLWTARLAASLEYHANAPSGSGTAAPPAPDLMRRLATRLRELGVDRALDEPPAGPGDRPPRRRPPGEERAKRIRRILETVRLLHAKLDRLEQPDGARVAGFAAPANDDCASATVITEGTVSGSTSEATADGSSSCGSTDGTPDVWFRYTAAQAGPVTFDTYGSSYDTVLSIHDGCPDAGRDLELACNDDAGGTSRSEITLDLAAAEEVWVRVSGFGGSAGSYELNVARTRGIAGTITRQDTGAPLDGARVLLWNDWGSYLEDRDTGADGTYLFGGLADGTYYVSASDDGMIHELYDDVACPFFMICDADLYGDPLVVSGGVVSGIDLALTPGGTISGTVTDTSGVELTSAYMLLFSGTGDFLDSFYTGVGGSYEVDRLPPGKYHLVAQAGDYQDELYDDVPYEGGDDVTVGTQLAVTSGSTLSGIDFALSRLGAIEGTVTDQGSGEPLPAVRVVSYDAGGDYGRTDYTDADGVYRIGSLLSGTHTVRTDTDDYRDELYDDIPCGSGCDVTVGAAVEVVLDETAAGIDFALDRLGEISGTLTEEGTGDPIDYEDVAAYDASGDWVASDSSAFDGSYRIGGLEPGTYFVRTGTYDHRDELYDDIPCEEGCDVTTGTPVTTGLNSGVTGVDFTLFPLGEITGTVTHSVSGDPISGVYLRAYDASGTFRSSTHSAYDGSYSLGRLTPGDYTVTATSSLYRDEVYDDVHCSGDCDPSAGTTVPVTLANTTSGIDFALDRLGILEGRVTSALTGAGISCDVELYDASGSRVSTDYGYSSGYSFRGLAPGTYHVKTDHYDYYGGQPYQDELYDDVPCDPTCNVVSKGAGLTVGLNGRIVGVDFALAACPYASYSHVTGTTYLSTSSEEACERLTAGDGTTIASGADVTFRSGHHVFLKDGFSVEDGASFRVVIEPDWAND